MRPRYREAASHTETMKIAALFALAALPALSTLSARIRVLSQAVVLTLALAACTSTRNASVLTGPETGSDAAIEARLELYDPSTAQVGNTKRLDLTIHNRSDERVEFLYTVDWLDSDGKPVPLAPRLWERVALDAGASQAVSIEPMPLQARSFQLRYAPARR